MLKKQIFARRLHVPLAPVTLLLGALLASGAYAQVQPQAAPQLAMTRTPGAPVSEPLSADAPPSRGQAFETAPSLRPSILNQGAVAPSALQAEGAVALAAMAKPAAESEVPWALDADLRPWALGYPMPNPLNALFLTLPSDRDARILLPGAAADSADRARLTVSRYITDNIGMAAQVRGRQLELFTGWADNSRKQKAALPQDPWAVYQFHKEANAAVAAFKAKIQGQTEPALNQMAHDVRTAVDGVTAVMNASGAYEQKMQWYNVLLQLRDGVSLYQARVADSDKQILDAVAAYELENPPVARPEGAPPVRKVFDGGGPAVAAQPLQPALTDSPVKREVAQAPVPKEAPSSTGGLVVLIGVAAVVIGLFIKLRRRVASKAGVGIGQSPT